MKLNLGSGVMIWKGFVNFDCIKHYNNRTKLTTDIIGDVLQLPFKPLSFDEIYCIHVIEHLYLTDAVTMLRNCYTVLKPGGKLILEAPCIEGAWEFYVNRRNHIRRFIDFIYGGERNRLRLGDTYCHRSGWTGPIAAQYMQKIGFRIAHTGVGEKHGMGIRDFGVHGIKENNDG